MGQKESDLKSRFQLVGNPNRNSLIGKIPRNEKHAYITRTNAEWFHEALRFKGRVHVIGDIEQTVRVLESAHYLWKGLHHSSKAPQIARFQTWRELCNHSEQFEDREMIFARRIIEQYKDILPGAIVDLRNRHCQNEQDADLILSTAHKAKGREFSLVRLSNGFVSPLSKEWADMSESSREAEINLLYVALTRSIDALEPGNSILDCLAIAKGECQQAQKGQETKRPKHEPLPQLAVPPYKVMKIEVAKPEVVINQGLEIPPVKVAKPQFGHIDDFLGEENINSIDVLNVSKVRNMETVIVEEKVQMKEHKPVGDEVVVKPLGGKKRQEINARKAKEAEKNSAITISVMPPKASSRNRNKTPTPWTPEDDQKIYDLAIKGIKIESIARQVKRKPMGVLIRLAFLSVPGYDNQYICSEVLSAMMPSGKSIVRAGV